MKKFISTYIIASLGYICFFITSVFGGYIVFRTVELDKQMHDAGMGLFYWGITILNIYYLIHLAIIFIVFICFLFEILNKKKFKPLPYFLSKIHAFFIGLGIFFAFIPIYILLFWLYDTIS